jgi:hypothetical protein
VAAQHRHHQPPGAMMAVTTTNPHLLHQQMLHQHQQQRHYVANENKSNNSGKYAIKHKANRYVSGAIGILETSLNGEFILLENLSSNKNVNLKGWYIHR